VGRNCGEGDGGWGTVCEGGVFPERFSLRGDIILILNIPERREGKNSDQFGERKQRGRPAGPGEKGEGLPVLKDTCEKEKEESRTNLSSEGGGGTAIPERTERGRSPRKIGRR